MRHRATEAGRAGFSLLELIVVVGIIAVLVAILLPSLRRAKEHANQAVCANNLRQLCVAFQSYTLANEDKYPKPAVIADPQFEDWIYWHPFRDLNQSRIVEFLGGRFDANVFRCPSDDPASRAGGYLFSYSVNFNICVYERGHFVDKTYPTASVSRTQLNQSSQCALIVEESSQTINDGCWAWQGGASGGPAGAGANVLSIRHDRTNLGPEDLSNPATLANGRSNVGFCDGHVGFVSRADAYGRPFWDPRD